MFRTTRPTSAFSNSRNSNNNNDNKDNDDVLLTTTTCRQQESSSSWNKSKEKLARSHPNVKIPLLLEEKSKHEQILRYCDRMKSYPAAVDTLIRALQTIIRNPLERKYRQINKTHPGYQRSLAPAAPSVEQLLLALNFVPVDNQRLFLPTINHQLIQMALKTLQLTKQTPEYQNIKMKHDFVRTVTTHLRSIPTEAEQLQRNILLSKVPKEPQEGRGAVLIINLVGSDDHEGRNKTTLTRRFDGDDTLQDVMNWLGGTVGTVFLENLTQHHDDPRQQWSLVDVNKRGQQAIVGMDDANLHMTLQYLGFWPSGRLQLQPLSSL